MRAASYHAGVSSNRMPWTLDRGRAQGEMGYLPGLDGLRALAIIGVLLYHGDVGWVPGGFLGVDVFFVLSGFLITSLILEELDRSGTVNFGRFYLGRARRLLPALFLMLVVVGLAVAFVYTDAAAAFRADALSSIFYVTNWWYILVDQSYFEFTGRPALLAHLWSLAIEEQFYLIWPAVVFFLARSARNSSGNARARVRVIALSLAVLSTVWMLVLSVRNGYPLFADPSRAYFGTDAHAMGLLVGAALATLWRPGRLPTVVNDRARAFLTGIGVVSVGAIIAFYLFVNEFTPWLYRGGFLLLAVIVALAIAMLTHPAIGLGALFGVGILRYLGRRSYGIYLWHWPIVVVTRPGLDVPWEPWAVGILRLALILGIAELSYRFVEMPIRRGALGKVWSELRQRTISVRTTIIAALVAAVSVLALSTAVAGLALVDTKQAPIAADVAQAIGIADGGPEEVTIELPTKPVAESADAPPLTVEESRALNGPASALGDSVMLGARAALEEAIPGVGVDASVSRMPGAFTGRVKKLNRAGSLANVVIVHPATNGVLPEEILRDILNPLRDYERVVLVNAAVPRSWEKQNNAVIRDVAPDFPNVVVADWNAAADGNRNYFVSDGIHLTRQGAKAYASLIAEAAGLTGAENSTPGSPPEPES